MALFFAGATAAWAASFMYRPNQEYRSTTGGAYEVIVQKNGKLDVNIVNGTPVFMEAYPMVWLDGAEAPQPLPIDGRRSTRRDVNDRLGKGQGMELTSKECTWTHNVYPIEPFLTVQLAFTNTTKKPVRVKALLPWCAGEKKSGGLTLGPGSGESAVLENGQQFPGDVAPPPLTKGPASSLWNLAAFNPQTGRSLIAGFLTHDASYTRITLDKPIADPKLGDRYGLFRAECVFDPPVELAPGQQIVSEVLYLGVAEANPFDGLERYGRSIAKVNQLHPRRTLLPHGWDSWSTEYRSDINEARILENLGFVDANLKRFGWTHFAIDDGWQNTRGDWEPNPERFPRGMKTVADTIHAKGMTAGLWVAPFTVSVDSQLAKAHPDWLAAPSALGKEVVNDNERILDVTAPGAYEYVRDLAHKITQDWGFDALMEADYVYQLCLADRYHDTTRTRIEVFRRGMAALREGMGNDKFLVTFAPLLVSGMFADGLRLGNDCAPIWRKDPNKWPWGCVETLTTAARRYYFSPYCWAPDVDCAFFGHDATRARWDVADKPQLTRDQSTAWLTGAALAGGTVLIGDRFSDLKPDEVAILAKLLPVPDKPARPIDLFRTEHPSIWVLPVHAPIGDWTIVAVFNWDETAPHAFPLSFAELGLDSSAYYTVYGFWEDTYYGTAQAKLDVNVPPGGVRLLSLRPFDNHPMFLSTNRHFTQGATDFTALEWNAAARTLHGAFTAVENNDYALKILVPQPFEVYNVSSSITPIQTRQEGNVMTLSLHTTNAGPVSFEIRF